MSEYDVVLEETRTGFSAHARALPGCIATGDSEEAARERMRDAIVLHLEGLRKAGVDPPAAAG